MKLIQILLSTIILVTLNQAFAGYPGSVANQSWAPSVWDLKLPGAVGPKSTPLKIVGQDALPACATYDNSYVYIRCTVSLDGWDFFASRRAVHIDAPNVVITNSKFGHVAVGYPIYIGQSNIAGTSALIDHSILDGTDGDDRFGGLIHVTNNAVGTLTYSHIYNSRMAASITTFGGRLIAEHNWWGAAPVDGPVGTHGESSHPMGGSSIFRDNLFDQTDGVNRIQGFSAILFIEGLNPISEVLIERNIFYGMKAINGYYAIGSSKSVANLRIRDNLIESGINGAHTYPGLTGLVEFARNYDYDSGQALAYDSVKGAYISGGVVVNPGPVADITAPTISVISPRGETFLPGDIINISVLATDNVGIKNVIISLNGSQMCTLTSSPYTCNVTVPSNILSGVYSIAISASDTANNITQSSALFSVGTTSQPIPPPPIPPLVDDLAPAVQFTSLTAGQTFNLNSGVSLSVNATDNVAVKGVNFYINSQLACQATAVPFTCPTTFVTEGTYQLMAKAFDAAGNVGEANILVQAKAAVAAPPDSKDIVAPTVEITAPTALQTLVINRKFQIKVKATDNIAVKGVNFYINDKLSCQAKVAPFVCNARVSTAGIYKMKAKAYDAVGNVGESLVVSLPAK